MPCGLICDEPGIILKIKMQVPYKIVLFEHFTSEFPDDRIWRNPGLPNMQVP